MFQPAGSIGMLVVLLAAGGSTIRAETLRYAIDLPAGRAVTYQLTFAVRHPGSVEVHAEWSGDRALSLKLTPPGNKYGTLLRSGPSPLDVTTDADGELGEWRLRVHALARRDAGEGLLVIRTPAAIVEVPRPVTADATPDGPLESWMEPPDLPDRVPSSWLTFLDAIERYRTIIAGEGDAPVTDVCQWQSALMRYLAERRGGLLADGVTPARPTADLLTRIAATVDLVERLRTSDDPLVAGPPPTDAALRNAWVKLRTTRIDPVEDELDEVLRLVQRAYAAELDEEPWPVRFVSCLTACERYFEQSARLGETRAENRDLALAQWPRILAASRALAELAAVEARPAPPR